MNKAMKLILYLCAILNYVERRAVYEMLFGSFIFSAATVIFLSVNGFFAPIFVAICVYILILTVFLYGICVGRKAEIRELQMFAKIMERINSEPK